ncbi:hypothetical protein ACFY7C_02555 [Streptomyces sp. NPDC012769]|uniref:hypothetical protein n=1 Tax=Streptomyces sp. NPDC012769 TaxID=3364848 RepID=UPI00368D35A8
MATNRNPAVPGTPLGVVLGTLLSAALLTGCGASAPREDAATRAGREFAAALAARDYPTACALLAPESRDALTEDGTKECVPALRDAGLPPGGADLGVQVYGRQALLRMERDTLFLSLFERGWRVTAAGCEPEAEDEPYRCSVKGD